MRAQIAALFLLASTSFAELKLDPSFNPNVFISGAGYNPAVGKIVLQTDGKIVIGGSFTNVGGLTRYKLARLNANGSVDGSFAPPTTMPGILWDVVLQPDGKILYTGDAPEATGSLEGTIIRLNPDGSVDPGFNIPRVRGVTQIIVAADGKIYIAGVFRTVDGEPRCYLARLQADGGVDETFSTPVVEHRSAEGGQVRIALQPDGKILMAGMFYTTDGGGIFRQFNQDGSLDAEFEPGGVYPNDVYFCSNLQVLPNGHILHVASKQARSEYALLRVFGQRGELIPTFRDDNKIRGFLHPTLIQPDGKIIFGGRFLDMGRHLARVYSNGSIDPNFDVGSGFAIVPGSIDDGAVSAIVAQPDGKLLIGGGLNRYNGESRTGLVRLIGESAFATKVELRPTGSLSLRWQTVAAPQLWKVESSEDFRAWNVVKENAPAGIIEVEEIARGAAKFYRALPQE
jgi:uncharacterized delta-60 repeat protein